MIFYDETKRRRYLFWIIAICFIGVSFIAIDYSYYVLNRTYVLETSPTTTAATSVATTTDRRVVLTFDDGPNDKYTEKILDTLIAKQAPATFFFVGERMIEHPDIVRRVYEAGYEIGNHTYSHSRRVHESPERIQRELLATNKLIAQYTEHRSILYRPPFLLDLESQPAEVIASAAAASTSAVMKTINNLGFVVVGSHVDSDDWETTGPGALVREVIDTAPDGHIILMHDGGGNRSATLAALPIIIDEMRAEGYQFVSMSDLLGLTKDTVMPVAFEATALDDVEHFLISAFIISADWIVPGLLLTLIFLVLWRGLFISIFALLPRRRYIKEPWQKGVSIVIPTYNEEKNIEGTIRSVLSTTIRPREIIVSDDGSTDRTSEIVKRLANELGEDIYFIKKENGGKASALNAALPYLEYEVMITMDGDSVIERDAPERLAAHFNDPNVGAVGGKVLVAQKNSLVSLMQDLEYTVAQNIEKRAFDRLGAVGVIPGALGAWRVASIRRAGGFSADTLVEDQDLTYAMHAQGERVVYEPRARVYTEVPTFTSVFYKQRLRWMFGTLQCVWKYRRFTLSFMRPGLGFVLLPYMIVYNFFVPLLWPCALAIAVVSLMFGNWEAVFAALVIYFVIDAFYTLIGLLMEPKKLWLLAVLPLQRVYYRVVFGLIILVCAGRIFQGTRAYWQKIHRTGGAQQYFETNQKAAVFTGN